MPATTSFTATTRGWRTWRRLNASSCLVSAAAFSRRLLDPVHELAQVRPVGRQLVGEQRGVAEYAGQQVVEVVRDAAGEAADALHLLGLEQLLLEAPGRRDVDEQDHGPDGRAVAVLQWGAVDLDIDDAPVAPRALPVLAADPLAPEDARDDLVALGPTTFNRRGCGPDDLVLPPARGAAPRTGSRAGPCRRGPPP